jgi:hypothetical protein
MNKDELFKLIKEGESDKVIEQLFSGAPQAFSRRPTEYAKVKAHLGTALSVSADSIVLVGSGRFGFSLAPHKFGRPYHDRSDLDFVIVDSALFDAGWLELVRYDFKSLSFDRDTIESLWEHKKGLIFWGVLEPYNLKAALSSYRKVWFPTFASLGVFAAIGGRSVKARIYKSWEHARLYHRYGLRLLLTKDTGAKNEV